MRTINEIKEVMTSAFMNHATVREMYSLDEGERFDARFSSVSLENILFHIVASCIYVLEALFDRHRQEVDDVAAKAKVASVPWYHERVLAYQHGDALVLDEATMAYGYEEDAPERRVVKYAAVRDMGTGLSILASAAANGRPAKLTDEQLVGLRYYIDRVKIAGVGTSVSSADADLIKVLATVYVDPLVLNADGRRITDGSYPVRDAIDGYLAGVVYGGSLNKTKLVDAMQEAAGVVDVELQAVRWSTDGGNTWHSVVGNNYQALAGCFESSSLNDTLSYVVEG